MTVSELIEKLKQLPSDSEVWIDCEDSYYTAPLDVIREDKSNGMPIVTLEIKHGWVK